jgi:PAS domain S-box-containing protein
MRVFQSKLAQAWAALSAPEYTFHEGELMAAAFSADALLQSIADAVVAYDSAFQITFWSQSAAKLFGWNAAEAIGQSILKLLSLRVPCEVKLDALEQLRNAGSWNLQMELRTKDRELITVNVSVDSVFTEDGQLSGYVSTFKRLAPDQQALFNYQKSTEIFHNSSDIIVIVDIDWVVRSWNSAAARSLKRSASEVLHTPLLQVLAGAMPRLPLLRLRRELQRCGRAHRELNLTGADGQRLVLDTEISEIRSNSNALLGYLAIARDLTEIKRIANDYKTSEMRLRALISIIPDSFFLVNRSGKIVDYMIGENLSKEALPVSGCSSRKCLIGCDIGSVFKDLHLQLAQIINKCLSESRIFYFDYEEKSAAATRQSVFRVIAAGQDEVLIIVQDVTEQKQTQNQLRESEERFRALVEQKPVGICVMQDGRFSYVNPKVCELLGYSRAELMAMTTRDIPILPEDLSFAQQRRKDRLAGQYVPPYILRLRRKDGSLVYLETHVSTIQNQGRPAGLLTVIDVSGRLLG